MAYYQFEFLKQLSSLNSKVYKVVYLISSELVLMFDTAKNSKLLTEAVEVRQLIKLYEIYIDNWLSKKKDLFSHKFVGDSMKRALPDGSIAVLQKTNVLDHGNIGTILINGYDATIKKFFQLTDSIVLEPLSFNPGHKPSIIENGHETVCPSVNFSGNVYRGIIND